MKLRGKRGIALVMVLLLLFGAFSCPIYAQSAFCHGTREKRYVALTFDDGPHPRYTKKILSILSQYGIKATFFMIGSNVAHYPDVARAVHEGGHEIGCHTYSHPHMKSLSVKELSIELDKCESLFEALALPNPVLFRPPEGFRSQEQVRFLEERGYRVVIWSFDPKDWSGTPSSRMVSAALSGVRGGDILLFHDYISGQNNTIAAIEQLIPKLLESGYQFVTVSELISETRGQAVGASAFSACSFW